MLGRRGVAEGPQNSSAVDPDPNSMGSLDPYPGAQSGSRRAKMTHKHKKVNKFNFLKCKMFYFEG
jgi:hypothetical protein